MRNMERNAVKAFQWPPLPASPWKVTVNLLFVDGAVIIYLNFAVSSMDATRFVKSVNSL